MPNISTFKNDLTDFSCNDDAFNALIDLGYLGYDAKTCETYISNLEMMKTCMKAELGGVLQI